MRNKEVTEMNIKNNKSLPSCVFLKIFELLYKSHFRSLHPRPEVDMSHCPSMTHNDEFGEILKIHSLNIRNPIINFSF